MRSYEQNGTTRTDEVSEAAVDVVLSATSSVDDNADQQFTESSKNQRTFQCSKRDTTNLTKE